MSTLNLALFQALAAGTPPNPLLLTVASALAQDTSWACVALMAWAGWRHPPERLQVLLALLAAGAAALISHQIGAMLNLPRPFVLGLSPAYIPHRGSGSLPSTHATVMFTVAFLFLLRPRLRSFGWGLAALALLTGWARIYVGVHFPQDIAAGAVLGAALAGALWALQRLAQGLAQRFIQARREAPAPPPSPPLSRRKAK